MKTTGRHFAKRFGLILLIVLAASVWIIGCATSKPDPLAGFHFSSLNNLHSNKVITDDYQDYIQKLPPNKEQFVIAIGFSEDGTGQHAVEITIGLNGTVWEHVLIYDKDNKRINTIKYRDGGYRS
jgi:hypothetical protein